VIASKPPAIFHTLLVVNKYFSNMDLEEENKYQKSTQRSRNKQIPVMASKPQVLH
jgi:hypothetical protein